MRLPLAVDSNEIPSSSTPQHEPAPLAWTPMRARAMTPQTGGLRGFGLKRVREGEGMPGTPGTAGTPLLQAGHASEAVRRTRQRSDQVCAYLRALRSLQKSATHSLSCSSVSCLLLPRPQPQDAGLFEHMPCK